MAYGWEGKKVRLVPLDKSRHLDNALVWLNDPETTTWMLTGDFPISRLAEEEYFDRATKADTDRVQFAIETLAGEHIGFTAFMNIEWRHGTARSGTIIGPPEFRRQGYGTDAIKVRTRYAFEVLGLRLLLSEAIDGNPATPKLLLAAGYREVGRIPKRYWRRGAYRDLLLFALDRDSCKP